MYNEEDWRTYDLIRAQKDGYYQELQMGCFKVVTTLRVLLETCLWLYSRIRTVTQKPWR